MNTLKLLSFIFLFSSFNFAQEIVWEKNWFLEVAGPYCRSPEIGQRLRSYSKSDITKAKKKLKNLRSVKEKSEWDGIYYSDTAIGDSRLIWDKEKGFLRFYCYHYLDNLDYGKVNNNSDYIRFVSDKTSLSTPNKVFQKIKYLKIKFGERHLLVPENRIKDFIDLTAGLNPGTTDLQYYWFYWTKLEDMEKKGYGIPILSAKYKHLIRYPTEAKIISLEERKIIQNENIPPSDEIHYLVKIDVGKNKNIKLGMDFFVKDLGEWIRITKVFSKSAVGYIRRSFDEKGNKECWDGRGGSNQNTPCKQIKIGMKVKTKSVFSD